MKRFKVQKFVNGIPEESNKKYLIVNVDEPYALDVFNLIKEHEQDKGTWDASDDFKTFIEEI